MILKLWNEQKDMYLVQQFPKEVKKIIRIDLQILDESYGINRREKDLGGYVAVVDKAGIEELKQHRLKAIVPEYIEEIEGAEYISALFLCSNDFSIVVVCKKELKNLIECEEN